MSCDNASGPLNLIKDTGALDKCRVICEYKANYPSCTGTARNKGDHLQIIMETCVADVTYNRDNLVCKRLGFIVHLYMLLVELKRMLK